MRRVYISAIVCLILLACSVSAYSYDDLDELASEAKDGDPAAQLALGSRYLEGKGVRQNMKLGFQWVKKAADQGYAPAECNLGYLYITGKGTPVNRRKAFELYTSAAKKGNAAAQNNLGAMFSNGEYVRQDFTSAFYWFSKAAEQNYATAQRNLGEMYEYGRGIQKDLSEAAKWYSLAAEKGDDKAKFALSRLNISPNSSSPNVVLAKQDIPVSSSTAEAKNNNVQQNKSGNDFNSLMERAKLGEIDAQFQIGRIYGEGIGVEQNHEKAEEWYLKAAKRGHQSAQNNLGYMYEHGIGVDIDYEKAEEWYLKAAEKNNSSALTNLGYMYEKGRGVSKDYKTAFKYYTKGAKYGSSRSMNQLGWLYEQGLGVSANPKEAFKWYKKAADKDYASGLYNLGRMYEDGIGTIRNKNKAAEFYQKAAAKGHRHAGEALANLNGTKKTSKPSVILAKQDINDDSEEEETPKPITKSAEKTSVSSKTTAKKNTIGTIDVNIDVSARPRILILSFDDRSGEGNAPASAIINMMTTELHKTGVFNLVERERLGDIAKEQNIGQSGLIDPETAPKVGKIVGAQYVMIGAVTLYFYSEKGSAFIIPILGTMTQAKTAYVALDIRIVDTTTGLIVYTDTQTGEAKQVSKGAATDKKIVIGSYSKMIGGLLELATRDAVRKHVSAIKTQASHEWM